MIRKIFNPRLGLVFLFTVSLLTAVETQARNPFKSFLPERPKAVIDQITINHDALQNMEDAKPVEEKKVEVPPELALSGVIWNSSRPQAIINGQVVSVGDKVNDVEIKRIDREGVEGDFRGVQVLLKP